MTTGKLLKIGDVARELGVGVSTIRKYEAAGIILPVRTSGKHRLFTEDDARWLTCVRDMILHKGMTLEAIKRMIALVPCWELRQCPSEDRINCQAYTNEASPCWLVGCDGRSRFSSDCRTCITYKRVTHTENFKVMLTQLLHSESV